YRGRVARRKLCLPKNILVRPEFDREIAIFRCARRVHTSELGPVIRREQRGYAPQGNRKCANFDHQASNQKLYRKFRSEARTPIGPAGASPAPSDVNRSGGAGWQLLATCGGLVTRLRVLANKPSSAGLQPARRIPSRPTCAGRHVNNER